jgi:hypothetical protein
MTRVFVVSLAVAILSFSGPWLATTHRDYLIYVSFFMTIIWGLQLAVGLAKFRVRGLWLTVGLPLAAFWPIRFWLWGLACTHKCERLPIDFQCVLP